MVVSTARERHHIAAATPRGGRRVTAAWVGVEAVSSRPLRGVGGASARRGGGRGRGVIAAREHCHRGVSLRERCFSTTRERRHRGVRGASARRGSGVIAAAERCGRGVTAAWEGHQCGAGAASSLRERGVSTARERRHRGARGNL